MNLNYKLLPVLVCVLLCCLQYIESARQIPPYGGPSSDSDQQNEDFNTNREKRLVGGARLKTLHWPWLALVRMTGQLDAKLCGGTLLNTRWVLTAASCVIHAERNPGWVSVKLGEKDVLNHARRNFKATMGKLFHRADWKRYQVKADMVLVHPKYRRLPRVFDVALIRLSSPVPSTPAVARRIQPAVMPSLKLVRHYWPPDGTACIIAGWGCTREGMWRASDTATEVHVTKLPATSCGIVNPKVAEYKLCTGNSTTSVGLCLGDAGSPMVCRSDDDWVVAGVVTLKSDENYRDQPFTIIGVTKHMKWISNSVQEN